MKLMTRVDGLWAIVPLPLSSNSRILIDFLTDNYVLENKNIANLCIDYNGQMIPLLHENELTVVVQLIVASSMDPNITQKWVSFLYLTQTHISISHYFTRLTRLHWPFLLREMYIPAMINNIICPTFNVKIL